MIKKFKQIVLFSVLFFSFFAVSPLSAATVRDKLHTAISEKNIESLLALADRGMYFYLDLEDIQSIVDIVVEKKDNRLLQMLVLQMDVDLNVKGRNGRSLLQIAMDVKDTRSLLALLGKANVNNFFDFKGVEARLILQIAIDAEGSELFEFLIERVDSDFRDKNNRSLLQIAIEKNVSSAFLLGMAIEAEDKRAVEILLNRGVDPNNYPSYRIKSEASSLLELAIEKENERLVRLLLDKGATLPSSDILEGKSPLHVAVEHESEKMTEFFLNRGINVDIKDVLGTTALFIAVKKQNDKIVALLLSRGANPNTFRFSSGTSLTFISMTESTWEKTQWQDVISSMITKTKKAGFYLNTIVDALSSTPLSDAILKESPVTDKILLLLLDAGADPNQRRYPSGLVPLHSAAGMSNYEKVKLLLDRGADPNIADERGYRPIDYAVMFDASRAKETVKLLLERGATGSKSYFGLTIDSSLQQIERVIKAYSIRKRSTTMKSASQDPLEPGKKRVVVRKGFKTEQITKAIKSKAGQGPFSLADIEKDNPGISMPTIYGVFRKLRDVGEIHAERVSHSQWVVEQGGGSVDSDSKASETNLEGNQTKTESEARSETSSARPGRCSTGFE